MKNDGRRFNIPPWMLNPELIAPCRCGKPFDPDEPVAIAAERRTGLKRWWHATCWMVYAQENGTDDYDDAI